MVAVVKHSSLLVLRKETPPVLDISCSGFSSLNNKVRLFIISCQAASSKEQRKKRKREGKRRTRKTEEYWKTEIIIPSSENCESPVVTPSTFEI